MINIYTDGACKGNPGPGGWGALIISNDSKNEAFNQALAAADEKQESSNSNYFRYSD